MHIRVTHAGTRFQRQQEANAKSLSAANASTEDETKELAARVEELDTLCKVQDEEAAIADAARSATLAVMCVVIGVHAFCVCIQFVDLTLDLYIGSCNNYGSTQ